MCGQAVPSGKDGRGECPVTAKVCCQLSDVLKLTSVQMFLSDHCQHLFQTRILSLRLGFYCHPTESIVCQYILKNIMKSVYLFFWVFIFYFLTLIFKNEKMVGANYYNIQANVSITNG